VLGFRHSRNGREGVRDGSVPAGQGPEDGDLGIWRPSAAAAAAGSRLIVALRDGEHARGARKNHEKREYAAGGDGRTKGWGAGPQLLAVWFSVFSRV